MSEALISAFVEVSAERDRLARGVERLREHRQFLWDLLDNIDTLDDSCRGDDAAFRKAAWAQQQRRFEISSSDGYEVAFSAALNPEEDKT